MKRINTISPIAPTTRLFYKLGKNVVRVTYIVVVEVLKLIAKLLRMTTVWFVDTCKLVVTG